jgi:hypothetical protein
MQSRIVSCHTIVRTSSVDMNQTGLRRSTLGNPGAAPIWKVGLPSRIDGAGFATLQCVHKLVQGDSCLTKNTLECANNQVAMHWHGDAPTPLGHLNMGATLPSRREAQALQRFHGLRSRDVPGQFQAWTRIGSLTKWMRTRRGTAPSPK